MRLRSMFCFLAVSFLLLPLALQGGPAPPPGQHLRLLVTLDLSSDDARLGVKIPTELTADQRFAVRDLASNLLFREAYTDGVDRVTLSSHAILLATQRDIYPTTQMPYATLQRTRLTNCAYSPYDPKTEHRRTPASANTGRQLGTPAATTTRRTSKHETRSTAARNGPDQGTISAWAVIDAEGQTVKILWLVHNSPKL